MSLWTKKHLRYIVAGIGEKFGLIWFTQYPTEILWPRDTINFFQATAISMTNSFIFILQFTSYFL